MWHWARTCLLHSFLICPMGICYCCPAFLPGLRTVSQGRPLLCLSVPCQGELCASSGIMFSRKLWLHLNSVPSHLVPRVAFLFCFQLWNSSFSLIFVQNNSLHEYVNKSDLTDFGLSEGLHIIALQTTESEILDFISVNHFGHFCQLGHLPPTIIHASCPLPLLGS